VRYACIRDHRVEYPVRMMCRLLEVSRSGFYGGMRRPRAGLIHHSDRGSQYASGEFRELLARHGVRCSMSGRGNCYDNAAMESFFGSMKVEWAHGRRYETRAETERDVFEYIEVFYNRARRHSSPGYVSPVAFEAQCANP